MLLLKKILISFTTIVSKAADLNTLNLDLAGFTKKLATKYL